MGRVVVAMDPHKRSATIEVLDADEAVLGSGRFGTDAAGYAAMKLSARARVFATGQGRKTDATDAHSVALVATRMVGLRPVVDDQQLAVLRVLVDRRRSLGEDQTRMISQVHQLLLKLIPGGAKKDLSRRASQGAAGEGPPT